MIALIAPVAGSVKTQARTMFLKIFQSTFSLDRNLPTTTIDPTLQWVLLTGIPIFDATKTLNAAPISIQKPLKEKHDDTFYFNDFYLFIPTTFLFQESYYEYQTKIVLPGQSLQKFKQTNFLGLFFYSGIPRWCNRC